MREDSVWSMLCMVLAISLFACSSTTSNNNITLTEIKVTPAASSVQLGETVQFTAVGKYSDNATKDITPLVSWSSSDEAVATIDSTGNLRSLVDGATTITAIFSSITGSTTLTVVGNPVVSNPLTWTWVSGSDAKKQKGIYGTIGITSPSNIPGARDTSTSWIDSNGNLWLFGGWGYDSAGNEGDLNDLWKFDGTNWTWISGSDTKYHEGVYGTKGIVSQSNVPGTRYASISWIDTNDNFWLFGGYGYWGFYGDLWKFDGANWTWVSGYNSGNQPGVYGTKGEASTSNLPGGRSYAVSWIDSNGYFWLFGGWGYDSVGNLGVLNDLWKFDGMNWIWVSGADIVDQAGVYGTKGTAAASNVPAARSHAVSWTDKSGNFWLFSGVGYGSNDLWKFDGANWTWVSGSNSGNQTGVYGTKEVASASNVPGSRGWASGSWTDKNGNLWLFGGVGYDSAGNRGDLNDLWEFDGVNWTWMNGADTVNQTAVYGTKGTASVLNNPGARNSAVTWTSSSGLWLFGGATVSECAVFNDLWRLELP